MLRCQQHEAVKLSGVNGTDSPQIIPKYCLVSCWVQTRTNVSEQLNWAHRLKSILSNSSDQKAQAQQGSILCVCVYIYICYIVAPQKNCLGKSRLMRGCHVEITVQDKTSMFASRHNGWEEDPASDGQQTGLGNSDSLWPNMGKQQLPERGKYSGKMSETPKALESQNARTSSWRPVTCFSFYFSFFKTNYA